MTATTVDPARLYNLCGQVLEVVEGIYAAYGNNVRQPVYYWRNGNSTPYAVPETVCVTYTEVVHIPPAQPARVAPIRAGFTPRTAGISVWVWRALTDVPQAEGEIIIATGDFSPELAEEDANTLMTDAYIVPWGLVDAHHQGQLSRVGDSGSPFSCQVVPMASSGAVGGCRVEITLELS